MEADIANYRFTLRNWECIYLEEGEAGFYIENRGRATKMDTEENSRIIRRKMRNQILGCYWVVNAESLYL